MDISINADGIFIDNIVIIEIFGDIVNDNNHLLHSSGGDSNNVDLLALTVNDIVNELNLVDDNDGGDK